MNNIDKILYLTGVAADYHDFSGHHISIDWPSRLEVLEEIGYQANNDQEIEEAVFELDAKPWQSWLSSTHVITIDHDEQIEIRIPRSQTDKKLYWKIVFEGGSETTGTLDANQLEEVGNYYIGTDRFGAYLLKLSNLISGYHRLIVWDDHQHIEEAQLIVSPAHSFTGDVLDKRPWGFSIQLYALRSDRNWGIGDFTDLAEFLCLAAQAGADLVALNPLHAPDMYGDSCASPYSPSDRRFLNPLYIDPEIVPDYSVIALSHKSDNEDLLGRLAELRAKELVDYDGVIEIKYPVFERMFRHFKQYEYDLNTARAKEFAGYLQEHGERLKNFSLFEATHSRLELDAATDPLFHQYLQWLAETQFGACQTAASAYEMGIGLMRDLAVGAAKNGAEIACNSFLFCQKATVGAPPDAFSEQGQNWELPALNPVSLKADDYRYFINLIRANMANCGALRIDHILGLLRLWWCLPKTQSGAYVYYPLETLLAIVRLESHRAKCLVIGEDMGVVPDELRMKLAASQILGTRLFYFEKSEHGGYRAPQDQRGDVLFMVSNHDVATLGGWWQGVDLRYNQEIYGLDDDNLHVQHALRAAEKQQLLDWLKECGYLPEAWKNRTLDEKFDLALSAAIMTASASGKAPVFLIQVEDLLLQEKPVNIPGTHKEYPNWRRKLSVPTPQLFANISIAATLAAINQERIQ